MHDSPYEPPQIPSDKRLTQREQSAGATVVLLAAVGLRCWAGGATGHYCWRLPGYGRPYETFFCALGAAVGGYLPADLSKYGDLLSAVTHAVMSYLAQ